ncbi:MAG: ExbD/TolR family protein [Bacteroidaceae bacterium]|jgi:biopolymer transport protein ExbD
MSLKRKHKLTPEFSMASMTDVIFLMLIFFVITSTMVQPNSVKVQLPESSSSSSERPVTRIVIDKDLNYFVASGTGEEEPVSFESLSERLQSVTQGDTTRYVALYADESVPYRAVMQVLNLANEQQYKIVLAARPPESE